MTDMRRRSFLGSMTAAISAAFVFRPALAASDALVSPATAKTERHNRRTVRRVVTGHNPAGKAVFVEDSPVEAITLKLIPGAEYYNIWGADEPPTFPDDGSMPAHSAYFPPVTGFRFDLVTIPPQSGKGAKVLDLKAAAAELDSKLPGMTSYLDLEHPGMHRTDTVDYEYVVSGEAWLELDDGKEVLVRAGDTVVQNGTRHAWHNKGNIPCQMVVCFIGANRRAT